MANLKAVAEHAGVSISTVSRVMRNNPKVDPVIAKRVRASAAVVGYRPDTIARNLRLRTSNVIALLVPDIENPFFTAVARAVEDEANERGYSVLLCNTDEDAEKEANYLDVALQYRVAGAVIAPHGASVDLSHYAADRIPVVALNRPVNDEWSAVVATNVLVDAAAGIRAAVAHLAAVGWRRIAFVVGADSEPSRLRAFEEGIAAVGVAGSIVGIPFSVDAARTAVAELLSGPDAPDAILTGSSPMAIAALGAVANTSLRVGHDLGLVSVDDAPWAPYVSPPLTVVAQPDGEVGRRAAIALFDAIGSKRPLTNATVTLPATLTVRGSSLRH